ncbi:hypothetical protein BJ741DRAFT_90641 [Chytriomyces cf. hyalinus JEL632]|nr:hypothetical protein BJ741DRAFT_90641 [Chytriomyces cf. hyalinus JEL632]
MQFLRLNFSSSVRRPSISSTSSAKDNMSLVPTEIAQAILVLVAQSDIAALSAFARVNRAWNSIFNASISLLESVILSQYAYSHTERNLIKTRKTFKNWHNFTPEKERTDPALKNAVQSLECIQGCLLDSGGSLFVTASRDVLTCFTLSDSSPVFQLWTVRLDQLGVNFRTFSALAVSSKFNVAVVGGDGQYIALLSLATGELVAAPYRANAHSVNALCVDEVSGIVLSGCWRGIVTAYDIATHTILGNQEHDLGTTSEIQSGPSVVAVLSNDAKVSIWSRTARVEGGGFPYSLIRSVTLPEACHAVTITPNAIILLPYRHNAGYVIPLQECASGADITIRKLVIPTQQRRESMSDIRGPSYIRGTGSRWSGCFVIAGEMRPMLWNSDDNSTKLFNERLGKIVWTLASDLEMNPLVCVVGGKFLVTWIRSLRVFQF